MRCEVPVAQWATKLEGCIGLVVHSPRRGCRKCGNNDDEKQGAGEGLAELSGLRPPKKLWSLYIGVYTEEDKKHIEKIKDKFKCKKVHIYDAKTANVWGIGKSS